MKNPREILIIGAGPIGLSTADSLSARGARVTLIDKRAGPGQGASFYNSGMIHPSQALPWSPGSDANAARSVASLGAMSKHLLTHRMRALNVDTSGCVSGCVQLYDTADNAKKAASLYKELDVGFRDYTDAKFSYGYHGLLFPNDAFGNPLEYCGALAKDLKARGVHFIYGADAARVSHEISIAGEVIIAAGAQSAVLGKEFDISIPILPVIGHALNFAKPDISLPDIPIMHYETRSSLTVFKEHLRLSGTVGVTDPDILLDIWREIAPDIIDALEPALLSWSGERPMCSLGRPIIGPSNVPNIWINTGHAHMGWTLSAGSGDLMARMILDGDIDERFALPT